MMAVTTAPSSTPNRGLENKTSISRKEGISASPETARDICSIPNIKTEKPSRMPAVSRCRLDAISMMMPAKAKRGEKVEGLSRVMKKLLL